MTTPKTKECGACNVQKPLSEFKLLERGLKKGQPGTICKSCAEKQSVYQKNYIQNKKPHKVGQKPDIDLSQKVDLDFLLDLNGWSENEIKELLLTVKAYRAAPHKLKPRVIYERFFPDRGSAACGQILMEFREAAEHGLSFDEYLKTGRKFRRDGKKVIAPPKK